MIQACLGLEFDGIQRDLTLRSPRLPQSIEWLELTRLHVGDTSTEILLKRYQHSVGVEVLRKQSALTVRVVV